MVVTINVVLAQAHPIILPVIEVYDNCCYVYVFVIVCLFIFCLLTHSLTHSLTHAHTHTHTHTHTRIHTIIKVCVLAEGRIPHSILVKLK